MDSHEFHLISIRSYGFLWYHRISIDSYEFLLIPIDFYAFLGLHGMFRFPMDLRGCLWILMISMGLFRVPMISINFLGFPWIVVGFPWIHMDFHGFL